MCSTAAHLVDRVFPDVAVRQWVLSVPYELRLLLARRIDAFQALIRLFTREVLAWQQRVAKADGVTCSRGGYNVERRHSHLGYVNPIEFGLRSRMLRTAA